MKNVFILLALFQVKHFLCDFPLQGTYMLGKFKKDFRDWFPPLFYHAFVHMVGSYVVVILFAVISRRWVDWWGWLPLADMAIHFTVDRIKASPNLLGRWKPDNKLFWWALGLDQMAHHFTSYAIIFVLVNSTP